MYENKEVCSECGGRCCRHMSGGTEPEDFGPDVEENLRAAFSSGRWSIDWWGGELGGEMDPMFIRPRHKGAPLVDPSFGGECVFLQEDGCALEPEDRPMGCRRLEPVADGDCVSHVGGAVNAKEASVRAWLPYQDLLRELRDEL